jgi:hypothetical protein
VKELFPQVTLRLGGLETRVRTSIRQPWLWKIGIVRGNHQLLDAANLLVDEAAQLGRRGVVITTTAIIVLGDRHAA